MICWQLNLIFKCFLVVKGRLGGLEGFGFGDEGLQVRNPISKKIRRVLGLFHAKSYVGCQMSSRWCGTKIPTLARLPKKGVRSGEDQRGENSPTSIWRTGFIMYNKMIQALPEQGSTFKYKRAGSINMVRPTSVRRE
ncbi:hypothetical protein AVEN_145367-1 [Araneus ventricosus]|uniref:Uncharacterized protein n=1 Tax=Araneus ventricosus TaxID=182803 RepID=A0A4Y2JFG7_ARAVE|nr:hypothetical protein AVEN_145367-1 [Araneus ventricosus]